MEDTRAWLREQSRRWVAKGIVSTEQADAILRETRFPVASSLPQGAAVQESGRDRVVGVVSAIGGVVLGLGVVLVVASNWEGMSREARLVLLVVATAAAWVVAGLALRSGQYPRAAAAACIVASLVNAAAIWLIGQTYHVQAHDPMGFLVPALTTLAIAFVVPSRALGRVGMALLAAWWVHEVILAAGEREDQLIAALSAIAFGGLAALAAGQALMLRAHDPAELVAGQLEPPSLVHGAWALAEPLRVLGLVLLAVGLLILSFLHRFDELVDPGQARTLAIVAAFVALPALAAIVVARARGGEARMIENADAGGLLLVMLLAGLGVLILGVAGAVLVNLAIIVLALGLAAYGVLTHDAPMFALGIVLVCAEAVARYADFAYDLLDGGIVFIGAGLLLLALALAVARARVEWKEHAV